MKPNEKPDLDQIHSSFLETGGQVRLKPKQTTLSRRDSVLTDVSLATSLTTLAKDECSLHLTFVSQPLLMILF